MDLEAGNLSSEDDDSAEISYLTYTHQGQPYNHLYQ